MPSGVYDISPLLAGREVSGWVTLKHIYEIALIKSKDPPLELTPLWQLCGYVVASAKSLGLEVRRLTQYS